MCQGLWRSEKRKHSALSTVDYRFEGMGIMVIVAAKGEDE